MDNSIRNGRIKLEESIRQYECTAFERYPMAQGDIVYSAQYQKKIIKLIRKQKMASRCPCRFTKRVATALLAATMLLGGVVAISAGRRDGVVGWFSKVYENFTEIFFEKRDIAVAPQRLETVYLPTQLPVNYTLQESAVQQYSAKTIWINEEGQKIFFMQNMIDSKITLDHEDAEIKKLEINGQSIVLVQKNEKKCYYWSTSEYAFTLIVPDTLDESQCLAMIFSLQRSEG